MTENSPSELIVLSILKARRSASGQLILTQKYLDGIAEYAKTWPGPVSTLVRVDTRAGVDMDQVEIGSEDPGYAVELRPSEPTALAARLEKAAVILMQLAPEEEDAAALCHKIGKPVVFLSEYTPRTETQIVDLTTPNPLRRWRRHLYIRNAERKRRRMLRRHATRLQCCGTPTYDIYHEIVADTLLFFDNRVPAEMILSGAMMTKKAAQMADTTPLRLVFGGRLTAMKGVMDLPRVAQALDKLGVPYHMDICGSGDLEEALRQNITQSGLSDRVTLLPPMDFRTGWVPYLKQQADLFVCCHPQGDPSSTYSEVMSCGVPIIGYANEAFAGVVRASESGWAAPVGDPDTMAREVARLHKDRTSLQETAQRGLKFAREHCFEVTFARRTAHLRRASGQPTPPITPLQD